MKTKTHFFKNLNLSTILEPAAAGGAPPATKVVGTIGPSCQNADTLVKMLEAGMSAARIDLTWGPLEYHRRSLDALQEAVRRTGRLCAVMLDTLGREVMVRRPFRIDPDGWPTQVGQELAVKAGARVTLTTRDVEASPAELPVTYPEFAGMAEAGDSVYVGRYLVSGADSASLYLRVEEVVGGTDVVCTAQNDAVLDGLLTVFHVERSSDALLNVQNDQPLLSDYDKECIAALGAAYEVDFISLSYTRSVEDVYEARDFLDSIGLSSTKIFAKLESRQSLLNYKGTLAAADGVIVSRGNLGLDCLPEKMALIQKQLIQTCNLVGKPVLLTRLVDTMAVSPRPTRAEATDVANAVLDGVDGFLLGQETLRGEYPVEAVETVTAIAKQAERVFDHHYHFEVLMDTAMAVDAGDGDDEHGASASASGAASPERAHGSAGDLAAAGAAGDGSGAAHCNGGGGGNAERPRGFRRNHSTESFSSLSLAVRAMARFGPSSRAGGLDELGRDHGAAGGGAGDGEAARRLYRGAPYLSKVESIASSAVRAADKVRASLIVVYTHTGRTAQLVAKYRPPMPILTLVVPRLVSNGLQWRLEGKNYARQCMATRGLLPVLATPSTSGDAMLDDAVAIAASMGIAKAHDHIVAVQRIGSDYCVKIVQVDAAGTRVRAWSLRELREQARRGSAAGASGALPERASSAAGGGPAAAAAWL